MKIRNGFVSNSSSSSFIVAFDKKLDEYEDDELKMLLFGTKTSEIKGFYLDSYLDTNELLKCATQNAQEVFLNDDLSFRNPASDKESFYFPRDYWGASETLEAGGIVFSTETDEEFSKKIKKEIVKVAKERTKNFLKEVKKRKFNPHYYYFSYSDNDGEIYSYLEHEGIFRKFPYMGEDHH